MLTRREHIRWVWLAMLAAIAGCSQRPTPTSQPVDASTTPASEESAAPPVLYAENRDWTRSEAVEQLSESDTALLAAVRLVRLSRQHPLCVPDPLPTAVVDHLHVELLSEEYWALGWRESEAGPLAAPVLISAVGEVTLPVTDAEEETARLYISHDTEVFPHLIITPIRVIDVSAEPTPALTADDLGGAEFAWVANDGYPFVALFLRVAGEPIELARYTWDPFEFVFMGPLADVFPEPHEGRFELVLEQSRELVPVGGEIPEPPKIEEVQQPSDEPEFELPPF